MVNIQNYTKLELCAINSLLLGMTFSYNYAANNDRATRA